MQLLVLCQRGDTTLKSSWKGGLLRMGMGIGIRMEIRMGLEHQLRLPSQPLKAARERPG